MAKINSVKTVYDGITFHSQTEAEYYQHLKNNTKKLNIREIILQPHFELIESFTVPCSRCRGNGKKPSPKTGNLIKCTRCKGSGEAHRQDWSYTADFQIIYNDGYSEVIDVKGYPSEKFPLYKKMFEFKYITELVVVKKTKKGWVRK